MFFLNAINVFLIRRRFLEWLPRYVAVTEYADSFMCYDYFNSEGKRNILMSGIPVRYGFLLKDGAKIAKSIVNLNANARHRLRQSIKRTLTSEYLAKAQSSAELYARMTYGFGWPVVKIVDKIFMDQFQSALTVRRIDRQYTLDLFDLLSTPEGTVLYVETWAALIKLSAEIIEGKVNLWSLRFYRTEIQGLWWLAMVRDAENIDLGS